MIDYETIRSETRGRVGWITLHRPDALNALNTTVMREVVDAATRFDADSPTGRRLNASMVAPTFFEQRIRELLLG